LAMPPLRIRTATSADAAALSRLLGQLGYPTDPAEIPQRIEKLYARPGTTVLVAEGGQGDVVGVVTVHLFQTMHASEPVAWLTTLVVDEKARGQGIGSTLVMRAEAWAIRRCTARTRTTFTRRATTSTPASDSPRFLRINADTTCRQSHARQNFTSWSSRTTTRRRRSSLRCRDSWSLQRAARLAGDRRSKFGRALL